MISLKINNLKDKLITCGIFVVCLALFRIFSIPCPMDTLLGIPCPGCGMTRAYILLLKLDIAGAFRTHPMFWSVPILLVYYFTDGKLLGKKWLDWGIMLLIATGFFIAWVVKLIGL